MPTKPDTGSPAGRGCPERGGPPGGVRVPEPLLEAEDLQVPLGSRTGALARLVGRRPGAPGTDRGVSLTVCKGDVLGLVGEPGSGKTALARTLVGLTRAAGGTVRYRGQELTGLSERRMRPLRPLLQTVFTTAEPLFPSGADLRTAIGQALRALGLPDDDAALDARIARALERVGLTPAEKYMDSSAADLTAQQRRQAAVARAIASEPELLVVGDPPADEGAAGRAGTLRLLLDVKRDLDLTFIHVTADLAAAESFCDTIAVVHLGRVVESGPAKEICAEPRHPYTKALLAGASADAVGLPGPARPPLGCAYHPRCPAALDMCGWEARDLLTLLECRWLDLDPEQAEREQRLFGNLDDLQEPGLGRVALAPGKGHDAGELLGYLHRLREEASAKEPRDPFWRGVARLFEDSGQVVVEFTPAEDPVLRTGPPPLARGPAQERAVRVACHLYSGSA